MAIFLITIYFGQCLSSVAKLSGTSNSFSELGQDAIQHTFIYAIQNSTKDNRTCAKSVIFSFSVNFFSVKLQKKKKNQVILNRNLCVVETISIISFEMCWK